MSLVSELLKAYERVITSLELVPASGGLFEVSLDGELIFSKKLLGRHAYAHEVFDRVKGKLGEPPEEE